MKSEELAGKVDHTLLRSDSTKAQVERLCSEAADYGFAAVCIYPHYVPLARSLLGDTTVRVCTVVSFPHGADSVLTKVVAAQHAVAQGADEVDMVMNISAFLTGEYAYVEREIRAVVGMLSVQLVPPPVIKVIVETCYLDDALKRLVCQIVQDAGADFVKTSTGTGAAGATADDVRLLRSTLDSRMRIKASGGIRSLQDAVEMIEAGADRIGTSSGVEIMKEFSYLGIPSAP
jgi:deoxyribose-phosphate aldolase